MILKFSQQPKVFLWLRCEPYRKNSNSKCLIATKRFYFGVGGGTDEFLDLVEERDKMDAEIVAEFDDGMSNSRDIISLQWQDQEI